MTVSTSSSVVVITGNRAAAEAARLARVQVIAAYPITPQSGVVEALSNFVETGKLDAEFVTVESEHSAMGVCIGAAMAGSRVFTASSANGLAYMSEQLSWVAGSRLPMVMGCVNRAMSAPWNVLNDQQDAMSQRDHGWIQLYCRNNQEILDTFLQAFRIAETIRVPVMVCYDGFILSHTVMPVDIPSQEQVDSFLPPLQPHIILDPESPRNINPVTLANPRRNGEGILCHGYMEFRYLLQQAHEEARAIIMRVDEEFEACFGRSWGGLTWSYEIEDAEIVIVAAGSIALESTEAVDLLRDKGINVGVLGIRAYRPFPHQQVAKALRNKKLVVVFDKSLSYGYGGPICIDIQAALFAHEVPTTVHGYIAGLGGRDVNARQLVEAVIESNTWMKEEKGQKPLGYINLHY